MHSSYGEELETGLIEVDLRDLTTAPVLYPPGCYRRLEVVRWMGAGSLSVRL